MNYILKNNLNVESNYTKTANSILIDSPLSRDARIVFITLSSLASSFNPRKEFLCKQLDMSTKTLNKYLKELVQKGFLKIIYYKNKLGKFLGKIAYILAPTKEQLEQDNFIIVDESNRAGTPKFTTLNNKKNNNKHEKMNVSENIQDQKDLECSNNQENANTDHYFSFKSSKVNFSLFKRFSDFVFSVLGNLNTSGLDKREKKAFERFLHYRNEKVKLTYATKKALLEQALELKEQGQDLAKCVNQSVRKGYNELYAVMEFKPSFTPPQKQAEESFEYKPNPKYNGYCIW
ncbi:helix-turn-helix domain-containing protein [Helicobacter pylori]|uniref:helix-turn-helix domain-containing protein n=1 Tax=Helicobacter pylori TaxID=210 RepID=UPI001F0EB1C1|nr:helix-turn-helix domain-containing protein [Helicobacter pylori]MCH4610368.1 helix-turn-helix domain-containing protein [Helicobacter pylori]